MPNEKAAAAPAHSAPATVKSAIHAMTPEMQREAAAHLTRMLAIHVDILEAAAGKLKARAVDDSSCNCTVQVINAICSCLGTGLGSILGDLGL
jgi:hypothetical protein